MKAVDFDKHIREGWTVGMVIRELQPSADLIMAGESYVNHHRPFASKEELVLWLRDNYGGTYAPNKPRTRIPDVERYFAQRYGLK